MRPEVMDYRQEATASACCVPGVPGQEKTENPINSDQVDFERRNQPAHLGPAFIVQSRNLILLHKQRQTTLTLV